MKLAMITNQTDPDHEDTTDGHNRLYHSRPRPSLMDVYPPGNPTVFTQQISIGGRLLSEAEGHDDHYDGDRSSKRRKSSSYLDSLSIHEERGEEQRAGEEDRSASHSSSAKTQSFSSQSSYSLPTTPELVKRFDYSYPVEPHGVWSFNATHLDEIELLSVIEKNAETYSNEIGGDDLIFSSKKSVRMASEWNSCKSQAEVDLAMAREPNDPTIALGRRPHPNQLNLPAPSTVPSAHDKPFKCSLCPKSFTRNYDLTRHKSSHQDQRQHVCFKCGRSFNRKDALIRHSLVRGCGMTH